MRPNNPFLISGYYAPEYFCDRDKETCTITDALYNGRNITLIAPRRMGKTGLIMHVFHRLRHESKEISTFYMDIYSTQNLGDFVKLFANTVLGQLDSVPQKALARVSQFIKSCRPIFTFDEMTGMPKATIELAPASEEATLKEIFDYLKSTDRRCYIAIDEFQQIAAYPEKGVEALLRSYIQFLPNVNFIFAGSKHHVMQEMFLSAKKPFYQSTQILSIGSIAADVYYDFASSFFIRQGRVLPNGIFEMIYNRFDGHTWYIQCLLNRLYSYSEVIDEKLLVYAMTEIVEESTFAYENLVKAYPAGSIRLLKAIASEGRVVEALSGEFISRYGLKAASSVSSALRRLVDHEMVYKTDNGYIVYDRFMGEWLRSRGF